MFLIDTDVLSALRKRQRNPHLVEWIARQRDVDLHLSAITLGEIERGIALEARVNPEFGKELTYWLDRLLDQYGDRVLPVDRNVTRRWGALSARIGNDGADLLIAATALEHGLTVVTRNVKHFKPTGVETLNPFG